ncbi:nickel-dependent hydrogenase large subunit [Desulfobaculum sp. SPO524]|uniref:nickel-dependent hydrogenase large subunit n=1 Tax=Desulfobaculum sp. SPO524 TaxID=3378071 RepID=UPI0038529265
MAGCKSKAAPVTPVGDYTGKVVIDPINRIEGHLRIEVEVENGRVKNAWSSSQLFRGLELILQGRDPRDAKHFTQRACGVCTHVHALASTRCVDNAIGVDKRIPESGRILRNMLLGAQFMHDHIVHFYHLHALDWVDVVSALSASPKGAADLANGAGLGHRKHTVKELEETQARLKKFVGSGQLGIFSNAYFLEPHAAYKLPPELNLLATHHYLQALKLQILPARMMAIIGGKNPHTQSLYEGGITCYDALKKENLAQFKALYQETIEFVNNTYLPDILAVAPYYLDWGGIGGTTHFQSCGEFPTDEADMYSRFMPSGVIYNRDIANIHDFDLKKIEESVKYSWYKDGDPKHPWHGVTEPEYTGMDRMTSEDTGKYSWMKAPRYNDKATEVGPLAQVLVAYGRGHKPTVEVVNKVLSTLGVGPEALFSTLGRTAARCIETKVIGDEMVNWIEQLEKNISMGKTDIVAPFEMPDKAFGVGLVNAPRGTLSHWVEIEGGKIKNFQLVVPSTWNLGPRSDDGTLSPVEEALIGTPVFDPKRPVEILRTVHSYDPCIACGVHVIDPESNETYKFKVC